MGTAYPDLYIHFRFYKYIKWNLEFVVSRAALRATPFGRSPRRQPMRRQLMRRQDVCVAAATGFHTGKHFSDNFPQFRHEPSKLFFRVVQGRKSSKNIGLRVAKLLSCLERPHMSAGPAGIRNSKIDGSASYIM
jgi:hypothetical protein